MGTKEKMKVLTGGIILIALGILIFLNTMGYYGFDKSWPIFLIVISMCALVQQVKDIGGWLIGFVGIAFLVIKNVHTDDLDKYSTYAIYALPALLVLLGLCIIVNHFRKRESD
jgi:bacteriorhodopsin